MKKKFISILEGILAFVILLIVWNIASDTGIFGRVSVKSSQLLLPKPDKVFTSMADMIASGYLPKHIGISLLRVVKGFLIAVAIGIPVGIGMGMNQHLKNFLNPIFRLFAPIPGVAWVPLAILWFGLGNKAAIFIIVVGSVSPIIVNTLQGVGDVDANLVQALKTLGANRKQIILRCIVPSIIPHIVSGFKLGLGFAWRVVIAAELVGVPDGMGYVLNMGRNTGKTDVTIVTILSLGIIMILMEELFFVPLEKTTHHWKKRAEE
jgi:ABC-type nitrate/sulfonate/bicarbonate transport system permease component